MASRYREVMDEYQDSNQVQNCIFRALSDRERRLFAVGDVKQSIYRFRLADPTIFLEKYCPMSRHGSGRASPEGALSRNFAPCREVKDGTNRVPVCYVPGNGRNGLRRRRAAVLRRGGGVPAPAGHGAGAALHQRGEHPGGELRPDGDGGPVHGPPHPAAAGREIPGREDGRPRPVEPEDIVIHALPRARLAAYTAALRRENIPCTSGESEAFFSTPEAAVMVSFCRSSTIPRQDVPLIALLRSPLFGFSADRLAPDPGAAAEGDYYDALCLDDGADTAGLPAAAGGAAAGGPGHDGGPPAVEALYECHALAVFGAMEGGAPGRRTSSPCIPTPVSRRRLAGGGLFDFVTQLHDLLEEGRQPPSPPGPPAAGCRS